MYQRHDARRPDELRPLNFELGYLRFADGSCLATAGATRVLCAATVENRVPHFLVGSGLGWVTGEYSLLPRSTATRSPRESVAGRPSGRTQEISRLIGRALRAVCDRSALGERTVIIDCDVLQADGGTRALAVTGGYLALAQALAGLAARRELARPVLIDAVAGISVGIVHSTLLLDLAYDEDVAADIDLNLVRTGRGQLVEVQATAEGRAVGREVFDRLLDLALRGSATVLERQAEARRGANL